MTEKTVTKSVRLDKEVAEFYEDKPLRGILESLYELSSTGAVEISCGEIKTKEKVFTPTEDMAELESMAKCWNTTADALISDFVYLLQDGSIKMRNGMLWVDKTPRNWEKFEEECKKRKMSTEHALKNFMAVMV